MKYVLKGCNNRDFNNISYYIEKIGDNDAKNSLDPYGNVYNNIAIFYDSYDAHKCKILLIKNDIINLIGKNNKDSLDAVSDEELNLIYSAIINDLNCEGAKDELIKLFVEFLGKKIELNNKRRDENLKEIISEMEEINEKKEYVDNYFKKLDETCLKILKELSTRNMRG